MAKQSYNIPIDLDKSYMDMEISLKSNSGVGVRPLPVKVILVWIVSALLLIWSLMNTFMKDLPVLFIVLYVLTWVAMTILLSRYNTTQQMGFSMVLPFINYVPIKARRVITRRNSNATPFWQILGIDYITEDGLIKYIDSSYGVAFRVVGSASILLFEEDRNAILDRVDSFYMKFPNDSEIISITTKEAQKIYKQVASLKRRYNDLNIREPELLNLLEEQYDVLKNWVGNEFKSIHQYWIIKSPNKESLKQATSVLQAEVENSSLMIKSCTPLNRDDFVDVLKTIYSSDLV